MSDETRTEVVKRMVDDKSFVTLCFGGVLLSSRRREEAARFITSAEPDGCNITFSIWKVGHASAIWRFGNCRVCRGCESFNSLLPGSYEWKKLVSDERFCALQAAQQQVLLLFKKGASTQPIVIEGGTIPPHDGSGQTHLAFAISVQELVPWEEWLEQHQVVIESKVRWERGGQSIYFRDPDGHLLELVTPGCWAIY